MKIKDRRGLKCFITFLSYMIMFIYCMFIGISLKMGDDNFIITMLHYISNIIPSNDVAKVIFFILIIALPSYLILFLFRKINDKLDFKYLSKF